MSSSRLQLISKKLIRPSITTQPRLRNHKLSIMDQLMTSTYIPMVFFYPNQENNTSSSSSSNNSSSILTLEKSLSKVLTSYYPLAGRLIDNRNIDCNDIGATLVEAHVGCKMSQISRHPNANAQDDVIFPNGMSSRLLEDNDDNILIAQLSHFDCGGKALSLCMSHRIGDAQTLCNFASDWAALTRQAGGHQSLPSPYLNVASLLHPLEDPSIKPLLGLTQEQKCTNKRYVFPPTKINQLKSKASADTGIQNPTRVEVVTALLNKCANAAASMVHQNSKDTQILAQMVNMRPLIMDPNLSSPNCVGNLVHHFHVLFPERKDLSFSRLVSELRRGKVELLEKFKGITANELRKEVLNNFSLLEKMIMSAGEISNFNPYMTTSICRYPLHDIDFGWGNPEWISFAEIRSQNLFILMDDRNGDGVEAIVPLEENVMKAFECDPELLQFASCGTL
nr:BAHD acyltransferase [Arnebia euchroma]